MSSIYATIANNGVYNESHFVKQVTDNTGKVLEPKEDSLKLNEPVIDAGVARNLQWIGSEIGGESETDQLPRDYFGKTGTWEAVGKDKDGEDYPDSYNAHAWYVGAIPQLSIAAWVGNVTSESDPIADPNKDKNNVYGSNTAYPVWFKAMNSILDKTGWEEEDWQGKDDNQGNETSWDIELAGGPINGGAFCAQNGDDPLCAGQQQEEEKDACEEGGGTWENDACTPAEDDDENNPGDDTSADPDPGEGDTTTCEPFDFTCNDDGATSDAPTTEGATTEEPENGNPND
jgi:membrane peptidoglycan carboxypeptidase